MRFPTRLFRLRPSLPPFFSSTAPLPRIPGFPPLLGGALSDTALLTSMVYHMDRIDNPDINPKPGTLGGIRCNGEIHVFAASCV